MNCTHCGAPMQLFRERDYYFCEHCGSYHFPVKNEEGIRVLGENTDGLFCPLCRIPLKMITLDDFYRGYQCSKCQSLLLNRTAFRDAVQSRRAKTTAPAAPARKFDPAELERILHCPICREQMETFQYLGPGNIVIDTCHQDDLIWLDYGEISKVVNAPGRDRGVPWKPPEKEDPEEEKKERRKPRSLLELAVMEIAEALFKSDQA